MIAESSTRPRTRLKICGITRAEDLEACAAHGVDAVGINLWSRSKRGLCLDEARLLVEEGPGGPQRPQLVGVFVEPELEEVRRAIGELELDAVQLHDDRDPAPFVGLFEQSDVAWVWVVRGTPALPDLVAPTPHPGWVLLDARVEAFGGAGQRTDWGWAAQAVRHLDPLPVWLAGGISPDNAAEAIGTVRPAGLDVASGAERPDARRGEKDAGKIAALVAACRNAG